MVAFCTFSFICLERFNLPSNYTPRYFVKGSLAIGIPLKKFRMAGLIIFTRENNSNCLFTYVGVKNHFPLTGPSGNCL